jgi:hypothetical protein
MREEAASAGFYKSPGWNESYPRIQLLTIAELLEGKMLAYPHQTGATFKEGAQGCGDNQRRGVAATRTRADHVWEAAAEVNRRKNKGKYSR